MSTSRARVLLLRGSLPVCLNCLVRGLDPDVDSAGLCHHGVLDLGRDIAQFSSCRWARLSTNSGQDLNDKILSSAEVCRAITDRSRNNNLNGPASLSITKKGRRGAEGEDLAASLTSVFAHFAAPGRQRVVAFNSESPHLPASVLGSAFEALTAHDVVVGPTHDDSYYLVGAKAAHPALFDGDGMGTKSAHEARLARACGLAAFRWLHGSLLRHRLEGRLNSACRGTAARSG